jgi:hypothetical protein
MPRAKTFMCWRVRDPEPTDLTGQAMLQTLYRPLEGSTLAWVTVARGDEEQLEDIAVALNKSKYQMFDTRPPDAREKACARGTKARSGRKS